VASLYAYTGTIKVKSLVESFHPWLADRCEQILRYSYHLQCHAALWREEFQKPSWIVYNKNCFWTTHGGSRLLVAYLRGDTHIQANILCQYTQPPFPGMQEFGDLDTNCHILKWDDDDHEWDKWCVANMNFEHGIKIKSGNINEVLIDKKPLQVLQGHYIPVTSSLLRKVSDWNQDKVYWSHGNN
jgi:hypothetical protein